MTLVYISVYSIIIAVSCGELNPKRFKVKVVLVALKNDKTLVELAEKYDVHA